MAGTPSEEAARARIAELTADTAARSPHLLQAQLGALGAGLVGPAELIRDRIAAYADLGVEFLLCKYYPDEGSLEELADVVLPAAA